MVKTPKQKRWFLYTPGIISLVLLPLVCLWYLNEGRVFQNQRMLEVYWIEPGFYEKHPELFPHENQPGKTFRKIHLTGNDEEDKQKLEAAQLEIRELLATKDTSKIIQIYYGAKAKYWTLIRTLDICNIEDADTYFNYENSFWIYNPRPPEPSFVGEMALFQHHPPMIGCGTGRGLLLYPEEENPFAYFRTVAQEYRLLGLLFLLLVCFGAFRHLKRFGIL